MLMGERHAYVCMGRKRKKKVEKVYRSPFPSIVLLLFPFQNGFDKLLDFFEYDFPIVSTQNGVCPVFSVFPLSDRTCIHIHIYSSCKSVLLHISLNMKKQQLWATKFQQ